LGRWGFLRHYASVDYLDFCYAMTPDFINGAFEFVGAVMIGRNVRQLYLDKIMRGVHWWAAAFFMSWGWWNLYYYPSLDQMWSFAGGLAIVLVSTFWLGQILYYGRKGRA
jgi:hypothetical protein